MMKSLKSENTSKLILELKEILDEMYLKIFVEKQKLVHIKD